MKKLLIIISVVAASCAAPETPVVTPQDSTKTDSTIVKKDTVKLGTDTIKK